MPVGWAVVPGLDEWETKCVAGVSRVPWMPPGTAEVAGGSAQSDGHGLWKPGVMGLNP